MSELCQRQRPGDNVLLEEAEALLALINRQISLIEADHKRSDNRMLDVLELRTPYGGWVMAPLLEAKAQVLHTIALLKEM